MTFADAATVDLLNVIADAPLTFEFAGAEYTGTRGALINRQRFGEGGFLSEPDLAVVTSLRKKDAAGNLISRFPLDVPPVVGEKLTVDDVDYRIEAVHKDEFSAGIQFDLVSTSRGA